jgi:uncharacterized phage protein (TIGR01671 family)
VREIKFRAWNRTHNYMQDFNSHKSGILYSCGSFDVSSGYDSLDEPTFEDDTSEEWAIMQFIGRQDSNYADLYEGDVICDHVGRGVIKWWGANNAFKVSYVDGNKGHGKWFADYTLKELESILKIGNIHENKELLCED